MNNYHSKIEKSIFILLILTVIVTSIGAIVQIFPLFKEEIALEKTEEMRPYTPLEFAGFMIYKREGCYGCHSQQIRRLADEIERYGHYSLAIESVYDFPFAWGSKRTGPDLARVGEKYSDEWHVQHLIDPRSLVPDSIMSRYPGLATNKLDYSDLQQQMKVLKAIGVPYSESQIMNAVDDIKLQLTLNTDSESLERFKKEYGENVPIRKFNKETNEITEMDAVVAYLQSLGNKIDLKTNKSRPWYE